jgi:hypothetical protein
MNTVKFDTSIFGIVLYLLELNTKANASIGNDSDLENAILCYQGDYDAFEKEAERVDAMWDWYDDFFDDSDE